MLVERVPKMIETGRYRDNHSVYQRRQEAGNIRAKYPDRIPTIVEKSLGSDVPQVDKQKYLVPCDLTAGQFMYVIRKRMKMSPERALFIFVNNTIPRQTDLMSTLYEHHKDEQDGFLYVTYAGENTFG